MTLRQFTRAFFINNLPFLDGIAVWCIKLTSIWERVRKKSFGNVLGDILNKYFVCNEKKSAKECRISHHHHHRDLCKPHKKTASQSVLHIEVTSNFSVWKSLSMAHEWVRKRERERNETFQRRFWSRSQPFFCVSFFHIACEQFLRRSTEYPMWDFFLQ